LKDQAYVRNVVAHYRQKLDAILPEFGLQASSSGQVTLDFNPNPGKTFNRGYTTYMISGHRDDIASPHTPKHAGEPVGVVTATRHQSFDLNIPADLNNGDGLTFFNPDGVLVGTSVNRVDGRTVYPARMDSIQVGTQVCRNADREYLKMVERGQTDRRIPLHMDFRETLKGFQLSAQDPDGNRVTLDWLSEKTPARKPEQSVATLKRQLTRLGSSEFRCEQLNLSLSQVYFIPISNLNALRRDLVAALQAERKLNFSRWQGGTLVNNVPYPQKSLTYLGNVLNQKAREFYQRHGVRQIEPAAESGLEMTGRKVMTTKHCLRYELGACPHQPERVRLNAPLYLVNQAGLRLRLAFDCRACVMEVYFEQGESWTPPLEE
jgi:putative protease